MRAKERAVVRGSHVDRLVPSSSMSESSEVIPISLLFILLLKLKEFCENSR
jgi:hypothetical protein